jgi:hypothetical protein
MGEWEHIEHNRKQFKAMPRKATVEEHIVAAAEYTALMLGSAKYIANVKTPMSLCGKTVAAMMDEEDHPIFFFPIWLKTESGEECGCLITFEDRVLISWTEGRLRLTYFVHSVPSDTITQVIQTGDYAIEFEAGRSWAFWIPGQAFQSDDFMDPLINVLTRTGAIPVDRPT